MIFKSEAENNKPGWEGGVSLEGDGEPPYAGEVDVVASCPGPGLPVPTQGTTGRSL